MTADFRSYNQRLAIVFVMLGTAFITGGFVLHPYLEYSTLIGWVAGLILQLIALRYAIKWKAEEDRNK
ncbi:hypothetical protein [Halobacillus sp. A5]|uniref:hypothetical protein n=1 Tax=Halobacillus sp. A5 TaxID=2880263 RepID=UPI0020A63B3D|nr:hypothetical protein [Halobacillus sp. A5]MCP3027108.1 hypothetical protein [Halobacillus sp. A5]